MPWNSILYSAIGLATVIVLMPFVRFFLSLRYDPNRDTPEQRRSRGYGVGMARADCESLWASAGKKSGGASPPPMATPPVIETAFQELGPLGRIEPETGKVDSDKPPGRAREPGTDSIFMDRPLSRLFFEDTESEEIDDLRKSINETPLQTRFDPHIIYYTWKQHGLVFEFHFGKLVFIFLYAEGFEDCKQYRGELPMNLAFSDTRADVERKLGKPDIVDNMNGDLPVSTTYTDKGIKISFVSKDLKDPTNGIEFVGIFPVKH